MFTINTSEYLWSSMKLHGLVLKGHIQAKNDEICASKKIAYMVLYFIFLLVEISSYLAWQGSVATETYIFIQHNKYAIVWTEFLIAYLRYTLSSPPPSPQAIHKIILPTVS